MNERNDDGPSWASVLAYVARERAATLGMLYGRAFLANEQAADFERKLCRDRYADFVLERRAQAAALSLSARTIERGGHL